MATIEDLKFDLIIDDQKFNKQVQDAIQKAQDLNQQLSVLLNTKRQYAATSKTDVENARNANQIIRQEVRTREMERREIARTQRELERLNAERRKASGFGFGGGTMASQVSMMSNLTSLATRYVSLWGASRLIKSIANVTAEFELQRTTLRAILKDYQAADQVYYKLSDLALKSPFNFKELVSYAKQLSAYSIPINELYDSTKMLADLSAGLGVGMDRLVLAYGQIRSASFLRGQEVRQLTEAGVPILEELKKQFEELGEEGITVGDVFDKISKRLVPFEMVNKIFKNMTSEGGKFYQMQEVQAETLKGKLMILRDAYDKMFNAIGQSNSNVLKGAVDFVTGLAKNYDKTVKVLKVLIVTYGTYKVTLGMIALYERAVATAETIKRLQQFNAMMRAVGGSTVGFGDALRALMSSPKAIGAVASAIAMVATVIIQAATEANRLKRELQSIGNTKFTEAERSVEMFDRLVQKLKDSEQGSINYKEAISQLNNKYSEYLPNILNEANALDTVAKAHDTVTAAIYAQAKAYAYEEGIRRIQEKQGNLVVTRTDELVKALTSNGIADEAASAFVQTFRDSLMSASETDLMQPLKYFNETFARYFGESVTNPLEKATYKNVEPVQNFVVAVKELAKKEQELNRMLDNAFNARTGYSTEEERKRLTDIENDYSRTIEGIKNTIQGADEQEKAIHKAKLDRLYAMRDAYEDLTKASGKAGSYELQLRKVLAEIDELEKGKDQYWLQRIVNPLIGKENSQYLVGEAEQLLEYVDKIQKAYKEEYEAVEIYAGRIAAAKQQGTRDDEESIRKSQELYDAALSRKTLLEQIAKVLGVSINDKLPAAIQGQAEKDAKEKLETQIDTLKVLYNWYNKLKELGSTDVDIKNILLAAFPDDADVISAMNFKDALSELANELERLGEGRAANALRNFVAGKDIDTVYDALKATQDAEKKLASLLKSWRDGVYREGEGVELSLSKAAGEYAEAISNLNEKRKEAMDTLADMKAKGVDMDKLNEAELSISQSYDVQAANALVYANEKIRKEADDWAKTWEGIQEFDISNFSDMTVRELRKLQSALGSFSIADIPQNIMDQLSKVDGGIDAFVKGVGEFYQNLNSKVETKLLDKKVEEMKKMADNIKDLANSIADYGESVGNSNLISVGKNLADTIDFVSNSIEMLASGNFAGAAVYSAVTMAKAVLSAAEHANHLKNELADARAESEALKHNLALSEGVDSIFGKNVIQSIKNAIEELNEAESALQNADVFKVNYNDTGWADWLINRKKSIRDAIEEIGYDWDDLEQRLSGLKAIREMANDSKGMYSDMTDKQKEELDAQIANLEAAQKAEKQLLDEIRSAWSSVADDMADSMINAYVQMGDAAYDLVTNMDSMFADLSKSIAKNMISSFLVDNVIGKYEKQVSELYTKMASGEVSTEEVTRQFASIADSVTAEAKIGAEYAQMLLDAFQMYGVDFGADKNDGSLASGITSITENTADLLAAYINGIRADVAGQREDVKNISADMKILLGLVPQKLSLEEYLTRIEAHTADTAMNTASILTKMESIIGDGATSFVRVQ